MPAAIFVSLRLQPGSLIKLERSKWDRIAAEFSVLHYEEANFHPLADTIVREFSRPLPAHFPVGERRIELAPAAGEPSGDWVKGA